MKHFLMFLVAALVAALMAVPAQATPVTFTETFDGANAASGSGSGSAFSGGLDNTGWTGSTSGMASFLDAGGGFCMMSAMPFGMGSAEVSLSRLIGAGDNEVAVLDAGGSDSSGGVQTVDDTTFSWIFADDADNSFRVSVDVVSYDDMRLQVMREKDGSALALIDVDMTDHGLGNAPSPPDPTDIHKLLLDWTVAWDHSSTEWNFYGTVTHKNDAGDQTFGSYTQSLVSTTDYTASDSQRTMQLRQHLGSGMASAAGLNEVGMDGPATIPEPLSLIFFGTGVVGVLGYCVRRRQARP